MVIDDNDGQIASPPMTHQTISNQFSGIIHTAQPVMSTYSGQSAENSTPPRSRGQEGNRNEQLGSPRDGAIMAMKMSGGDNYLKKYNNDKPIKINLRSSQEPGERVNMA